MTDAIAWLDGIRKDDVARVGGKGANLGELFRAGFPVPRAFCVTTSAYQRQLESTGIRSSLANDLGSDIANVERSSESMRARLLAAPILGSIESAIRDAYRAFGDTIRVAVRSSATVEDLPDASFAGQMDTFLGVCGEQDLLEAVRKCWASLWRIRAIHYRNEHRLPHDAVAMAVVVQEMVPAEAAGVMFTIDPLSGISTNMTLTACYGLGETLVSGQVTPDTYTIAKKDMSVSQRNIGRKEIKVIQQENGTSVVSVPDMEQMQPCLPDSIIVKIAQIGLNIERHYGQAQDIEWAVSDNHIYILQARAVTGLSKAEPIRIREIPGRENKIYGWIYLGRIPWPARAAFPNFARDHFPYPLRPFDIDTSLTAALAGVRRVAAEIGIEMPADIARPHESGLILFNPPVPRIMKTLWSLPVIWQRIKSLVQYDPLREWREIDEPQLRALIPPALRDNLSEFEMLKMIRQLNRAITELMYRRFRKYIAAGATANRRLSALLVRLVGRRSDEVKQRLMRNLNHKTAQCNRSMKILARSAASCPAVREILAKNSFQGAYVAIAADPRCAEFAGQFSHFLEDYGFRTAMTMEPQPSYPAWRDEPDQVLVLIGSSMLQDPQVMVDNDQTEKEVYRETRAEIARRLRGKPKQFAAFEWAVDTVRGFVIAREASLFLLEEIVGRMREIANHLADHFVTEGKLRNGRNLYYLSLNDLDALAAGERVEEIVSLAVQRETVWKRMRDTWDHPADGLKEHRKSLKGAAVSRGVAVGAVKVVRGADEFHKLQSGDILVCSSTTPAWTPLFSVAAAVVTDVGGVLSHAAIVARECGIPAVMGCMNATNTFVDGELIEVNGTTGTVRRLTQSSKESASQRV